MPRSAGKRPHPLKLQRPAGEKRVNDDGENIQDYETFAEPFGSVEPATAARLERFTVSAVIGEASHIVTIPFMQGVELQQVVLYGSRKLYVIGYADPDERHIELVLVCQEIKK